MLSLEPKSLKNKSDRRSQRQLGYCLLRIKHERMASVCKDTHTCSCFEYVLGIKIQEKKTEKTFKYMHASISKRYRLFT